MRSIAARDRLRMSALGMRCASRPSATFSNTESQGNSAKLWNTMAIPGAGPEIGCPRERRWPAVGSDSPAIRRNSVDLPEPDRPSKPTIWPSRNSRFMPSSTSSSAPSGFGKDLPTSVHCSRGEVFIPEILRSSEPIFALGVVIQGPPEQPVDDHDEQAHGADSQHDAVKISGGGRLRDVRPQSSRPHLGMPPARQFRA